MATKVLLVDLIREADDSFQQAFKSMGYNVLNCTGGMESLESYLVRDKSIDAVVVNITCPTSPVFKTLKSVATHSDIPVVVFTQSSTRSFTQEAANIGISAYIVDGFESGRIKHIMDLAKARLNELNAIKNELAKTRLSLEERKIIEKAKGILMRRRTIDEDAAFRMMRKMAMDKNQKMAEVAKNIVHVDTLFT